MIPNQIELTLKILNIRGNGYDGVLIGNHNNILASGSISTEAARTATPHLIAITLHPVTGLLGNTFSLGFLHAGAWIDALHLFLRHFCNPFGWYQLLTIPLTFLEKQLAHLG